MSAGAGGHDGTIAALATPVGPGARAMIRLSGPGTFALLDPLLHGAVASTLPVSALPVSALPGGAVRAVSLQLGDGVEAPVILLVFRAPRSYTGEDAAELHLPGAPALVAAVLDALHAAGARPAAPGEFTRRAYLAGRIDLAQADGIQALVAARNEAERRGALALTGGRVSRQVEALRQTLLELLADMEAEIDFAEHEVGADLGGNLAGRLERVEELLDELIRVTHADPRPAGAPRAILWGRPNAGKSTLFNRLAGRDRARVSAAAGTTRDVLGGRLRTARGDIMLFDAPGVGLPATGEADAAALTTASAERRRMDLSVVVADRSAAAPPPEPGAGDLLLVLAKADLAGRLDPSPWIERHRPRAVVEVSAQTGEGLEALRAALADWVAGANPGQDMAVAAGRLRGLFLRAVEDLRHLRSERDLGFGAECLSVHVRAILADLEEVTGRVFTEDLLDSVFARFCIGK